MEKQPHFLLVRRSFLSVCLLGGKGISIHPVVVDDPGKRVLLMGNEAIAKGAIEVNVAVAAAYPGTPSSEIGNTLSRVPDALGLQFEWSSKRRSPLMLPLASPCATSGAR